MNTQVIGVVFLDIKGFPYGSYDPRGTNLGNIVMTHGGVARNVAENLANLGENVDMITMVDDDALGNEMKSRLEEAGVSLENAIITPRKGMGMWLAVFNEQNDLTGSISHMPKPDLMEKAFFEKGEEMIQNADTVVLEMDVSEKLAERVIELCNRYHKKVYVIVANMRVILARRDLMYKTSCVILNEIEAGRLFDANLQHLTPDQMLASAKPLAEKAGIRQMIVTMGINGCVYMDFERQVFGHCPPIPTVVQDTTGAGDAFFSATVTALSNGKSLEDAVKYGTKLASLTLSTPESVCPRVGGEFFR
ncbi:MAG: sugar kinase [Clostridiales bacterium]|nr:sugar kinase [Clostridiales bacterium]